MEFRGFKTLCCFIYICIFQGSRLSSACIDDQGFKVTSVCQDTQCEGRYVAITSANVTSNTTVTCVCDVTIYIADSALIRYKAPGYSDCGIYYDLNNWRFSCNDGDASLKKKWSRLEFHKSVTRRSPMSLFKLSIDLTYVDDTVSVQCYAPDSPVPDTSTARHSLTSTTTTPSLLSSTEPSKTTPATSTTSTVSSEPETTPLTVPITSISSQTHVLTTTQTSTTNATTTLNHANASSISDILHVSTVYTTASSRNVSTLSTVNASTSLSMSSLSNRRSSPATPGISTEYHTSVATSEISLTTVRGNVTLRTDTSANFVDRKVLIIAVSGGVAAVTLLVITVVVIIAIRNRLTSKKALDSSQESYIGAYDETEEEQVNISNVFVSHTMDSSIIPHLTVGDNPTYSPSVQSISSGSDVPAYQLGSMDGAEDDTDSPDYTDNSWKNYTGDSDDMPEDIQHTEGPVNSDIYAIVTRKSHRVTFEIHRPTSSMMSFKQY